MRKDHIKRRHPAHPVIEAFVIPRIIEIKKYILLEPDTKLLDVGCGNGFFTYYFDRLCNTYGIDISHTMLKLNPIKNTSIMDAENMGFKDNYFDIVFCNALLHHVNNPERVIKEMARVSKKYVVILEMNKNNPFMLLFMLLNKDERKGLQLSIPTLEKLAEKNALDVMDSFSFGLTLKNVTPAFMLPITKLFDCRGFFGVTNFIIAEKK